MDIKTVIDNIEQSNFDCGIFRRKRNNEWVWEISLDLRDEHTRAGVSVSGMDTRLEYALSDVFNRLSEVVNLQLDLTPWQPQPPAPDDIPF